MDNGDKAQDWNNISPIMTLPEEVMHEIFDWMSFQTLYFPLRTVCKNIQTYVDNYLEIRGMSFFFACQKGLEKEVIEIKELPKKGFIIARTPASTIPWIASVLQNNEFLNVDLDRLLDMVFYAEMYRTSVCFIYKSEKRFIFRYDLESEKWDKFSDNGTKVNCLDHNETSHVFIKRIVSKIIPYHFVTQGYGYGHYPFVQVKAKDKTWSVGKMMSFKRLRL